MSGLATLYFPAGVLIGMASAAPVGPVNLLVIQRSVTAHTASARAEEITKLLGDSRRQAAVSLQLAVILWTKGSYDLGLNAAANAAAVSVGGCSMIAARRELSSSSRSTTHQSARAGTTS